MRRTLRRLSLTLPAGAAALLLAACSSSTPMPSAADPPAASTTSVASTAGSTQQPTASALLRGLVVDSANRPVANANVECASNAQCRRFADVSVQDGPDDGVKTNAEGRYEMIVSPQADGAFLLDASAFGFGIVWRTVALPSPACSWDQARCALTVNFTLSPAAE